jgi:outer membrane protein assembly factor BamC
VLSKMRLLPVAVLSGMAVTGCSVIDKNPIYGENGVIRDRNQEYEQAKLIKPLEIPPHLQAKQTQDLLVVPKVGVTASAAQKDYEVPRPEFFYADTGSDAVSLKRVSDGDKIIIVDEPIDQVWNKVLGFMDYNKIKVGDINPREGVIESDWIITDGPQYHAVDRWIKTLTFQNIPEGTQDKLRVTLRPENNDLNKTAIVMQHAQFPKDETVSSIDWSKDSQDVGYKTDMMFEMLRYMSRATDAESQQTLLSEQTKTSIHRPQLGRDSNGQPVLKIEDSVDNVWTLVNQAADAAEFDVGTRDQKSGMLYMTYVTTTPVEKKSMGFFEWMFSDRGDIKLNTDGLASLVGAEEEDDGIRYSSKSAEELIAEYGDPEDLSKQDGYKIWLAGRVVYVFNSGKSKGRFDEEQNAYLSVGRYQLALNRMRSGVLVSVLDDQGQPADNNVAEEILWSLKDKM